MTEPFLPSWSDETIAILSTVGDHAPHAVPISTAVRVGPSRVMLALARDGASLHWLRAAPVFALTILAAGNVAVTAYGRARVVQEALDVAEAFSAVELIVERVHDHARPLSAVLDGVRWQWLDGDAREQSTRMLAALRDLSVAVDERPELDRWR